MTYPILLLLISLVLCSQGSAEPVPIPTKAGEYSEKGWKYVYEIQNRGTRSEQRTGRLFLNGKEVKGEIGELNQQPIGFFIYFGEHGYNQGWLNTLTYDRKVFEKDGTPTEQAKLLLHVDPIAPEDTKVGELNEVTADVRAEPSVKKGEEGGAANGSQPDRPETNSTPSTDRDKEGSEGSFVELTVSQTFAQESSRKAEGPRGLTETLAQFDAQLADWDAKIAKEQDAIIRTYRRNDKAMCAWAAAQAAVRGRDYEAAGM